MHNATYDLRSSVAVVGIAGRFAGADDIDGLWRMLCSGASGIRTFARDELVARGVPAERLDHPGFVPAGALFDGMDLFDAAFFDFTPREAEVCGPQQRLLLECTHLALENAGCAVDKLDGRVGTFVGVGQSNYLQINLGTHPELAQTIGARTVQFGNDNTFAATQIAYKLDLRGPAISIATACSTSLVAIHLARKSLLDGECDVAVAGGAQLSVEHDCGYLHHEGGIHSPDGRCRTFDASAQGTVSGNGVGVVVLRRLEDALADGDEILAVLRATALSNDGNDKVGYSAPSVRGQATAIAEAQAIAGVHPDSVGYIEAHGTATPLGDPIEIAALGDAFGLHTERRGYCAIGSLKSNLGHMGAAAGVGGFIKTVLSIRHGLIPPSLHFERANPALDLERSPFYVNAALREWHAPATQRVAGVSSFGMGGTNAHAVLGGYERPAAEAGTDAPQPIVLSAKTEAALRSLECALAERVRTTPHADLADIAYSLAVGRRDYPWRRGFAAATRDALAHACEHGGAAHRVGAAPALVFAFPGQGAQHPGMAAGVYAAHAAFRNALNECAALVRRHADVDVLAWLSADADPAALERTDVAQPLLFAYEYAYARLWLSFGLRPGMMIGHSLGEYVAATLAGVFELDAAIELVCARGRLMQATAPGAMLSLAAAESTLAGWLGADVDLAAVNAPELCVLSGPRERLAEIAADAERRGIASQWLKTRHAFHSAAMQPALAAFREYVRKAAPREPQLPFVSNVTGAPIGAAQARDPDYWVRHVRAPVRFAQGVAQILADGDAQFLEVGPGRVLSGLLERGGVAASRIVASAPHARDAGSDAQALSTALAQLWTHGNAPDWKAVFSAAPRRKVALPGHPLDRKRYWIEPRVGAAAPASYAAPVNDAQPFHQPVWVQQPMPAPRAGAHVQWLVLAGDDALSDALLARLRARGATPLVLRRGGGYAATAPNEWRVDAASADDYARLDLDSQLVPGVPLHVVMLWGSAGTDAVKRMASVSLPVVRLLERLAEPRAVRVVAVTPSAYAVLGDEAVAAEFAATWAVLRVAGHERDDLRACQIDVAVRRPDEAERAARAVLGEFEAGLAEPVVAWRHDRRYVRDFAPVHVDIDAGSTPVLRERDVCVITGGLGGIGLVLAGYLARQCRARLVLVGRTPLPAREDWAGWLAAQPGSHRTSQIIAQLLAIEAAGGEVLVLAADVASRASMEYVAERAHARFGRIDGVIHAAGVGDAQLLGGFGEADLARIAGAKADGLEHLDAVFGAEIDYMLLCSSQNAFKGGIGKFGYCAANAYLDACAERHAARHGRYAMLSLNWCAWRDAGMAVAHGDLDERRRREAIGNDEATRLFARAVAHRASRLVVSKFAVPPLIAEYDDAQAAQRAAMSGHRRAADTGGERPAGLAHDYVAPASLVEQQLCEIWEEVLGVRPVGALDNFFELGGSSLLVTQVALRVKHRFALAMSLQGLFSALTVREQAARVIALQAGDDGGNKLEALLAELESLSDDDIAELLNA